MSWTVHNYGHAQRTSGHVLCGGIADCARSGGAALWGAAAAAVHPCGLAAHRRSWLDVHHRRAAAGAPRVSLRAVHVVNLPTGVASAVCGVFCDRAVGACPGTPRRLRP